MTSMPVVFAAHGAPTLATDPVKGGDLARWATALPRPKAILAVSAHWEQTPPGTGAEDTRELIYDFYGFPRELYALQYRAPGAPELAARVREVLSGHGIEAGRDIHRGWDHGVWVPLLHLYPQADIPLLQLALPGEFPADQIYALGRALAPLRDHGVLILASGVLVHNLGTIDYREREPTPPWALEFDGWCARCLEDGNHQALMDVERVSPGFRQAHPTPEHFTPILVAAGAASVDGAPASFPVEGFEYGSLSRRCVQFG
jgi:4,5-DOPA dioxygenase extradiol